jgi:transcriptional regulator with XRE-family HTH domain
MLTQQDLADRAGLERSYISLLESGRRLPGLEVLIRISKALGIPLADFVREIESAWSVLNATGSRHK